MVKLWDLDCDVRNRVMLWNRVDESLELGHGNWPFPETSIATWRLSAYISGLLVRLGDGLYLLPGECWVAGHRRLLVPGCRLVR